MSMFFYLEDGYYYPTTAGSILMYVLAIAAVIVAGIAISKSTKKTNMSVKQLVFCAVALEYAVRRFCDTVQYDVYLYDRLFLRSAGRTYDRVCIQYSAVYAGTICTQLCSGML